MGIFDSANYAPQSAGLIDRLMQQLGVQGQYTPGAGFPQSLGAARMTAIATALGVTI